MKKSLKKVMLSLLAGVVCCGSMVGGISASADTTYENTYRVFFDVPANSKVHICSLSLTHNGNMAFGGFENGNLGGSVVGSPCTNGFAGGYTYANELSSSGTIFSYKMYSNGRYQDNLVTFTYNPMDRNNKSLSLSSVTVTPILLGDLNKDGKVSVADCSMAKNMKGSLVNSDAVKRAADINNNSVIDNSDIELMQKYLLGLIDQF